MQPTFQIGKVYAMKPCLRAEPIMRVLLHVWKIQDVADVGLVLEGLQKNCALTGQNLSQW